MLSRLLTLLIVATATGLTAAPQAPAASQGGPQAPLPTGTALIIGRVIDGTTGATVAGTVVTLGGANAPRTGSQILVDSQGRFLFSGLAAGTFTLSAQKNGYMNGSFGRLRPGGQSQSLVLKDAEHVTDAVIRVWKYASIAGTVLDEAGEPVANAFVEAYRRTIVGGHVSLSTNSSRTTDDRGVYWLGRLTPGEYVVGITSRLITYPIAFAEADNATRQAGDAAQQARSDELAAKGSNMIGSPNFPAARIRDFIVSRGPGATVTPLPVGNERLSVFPITFHPAAATADHATPISLSAGEQKLGIDIHLKLTPTVTISGTATGPDGPVANLGLRLQLGGSSQQFRSHALVEPAQTVTSTNGAFTFLGVPPGSYVITAAMTTPKGDSMSAVVPVAAGNRDIVDLAIALRTNPRLTGSIVFDGTSEKPPFRSLGGVLTLDSLDGHYEDQRQLLQVATDGTFRRNVSPGSYFIRVNAEQAAVTPNAIGAWTLQSAVVGNRDVSDTPLVVDATDLDGLVITLTDHPTMLSGSVKNGQGVADATATVLVFPTDSTLWMDFGAWPRRLRTARPDRTGVFSIPALPTGEYWVVAVPDELVGDWPRRSLLDRASTTATRVKIADGTSATVNLVTKRW